MATPSSIKYSAPFTQLHHLDIFDVVKDFTPLYQRLYPDQGRSFGFSDPQFGVKGTIHPTAFANGETRSIIPIEHRAHENFTSQFREMVAEIDDFVRLVDTGRERGRNSDSYLL